MPDLTGRRVFSYFRGGAGDGGGGEASMLSKPC